MIQFTIAGTGSVAASAVQSSTMNNPTVEMCIAGRCAAGVPKPSGGGIVVVTYPFVLKASEGNSPVLTLGPQLGDRSPLALYFIPIATRDRIAAAGNYALLRRS